MTTDATIVVDFGDSADSSELVVVELDGKSNLDSDGNETTTFGPGATIYFLVHHASTLRIKDVKVTHGDIVDLGKVSQSRTQQILFTNEDAKSLSYLPSSGVSAKWYGNAGTGLQASANEVFVTGNTPCLADISCDVSFSRYKLVAPKVSLGEDETYPVAVVVYMEGAE